MREGRQRVAGHGRGPLQLGLLALGVGHDGPDGGGPRAALAPAAAPPDPRVPLAHTRYPAHTENSHTGQ